MEFLFLRAQQHFVKRIEVDRRQISRLSRGNRTLVRRGGVDTYLALHWGVHHNQTHQYVMPGVLSKILVQYVDIGR